MATAGTKMIELDGICRRYRTDGQITNALDAIHLSVSRGEFVAVTGPSGSGKTTLLNVIGCLDTPDEGRYVFDDDVVSSMDDESISDVRNRKIGFVFQSFHLLQRLTVLENVQLPLRYFRGANPPAIEHARMLLERVGMEDRLNSYPHQLSGGQMQRVAIARALLLSPRLILADEPTGNLDSKNAIQIMNLLGELHASGQTIVLVTHDPDVAGCARRHIRLKDGKVWDDLKN